MVGRGRRLQTAHVQLTNAAANTHGLVFTWHAPDTDFADYPAGN
jgi:hypothetical protein